MSGKSAFKKAIGIGAVVGGGSLFYGMFSSNTKRTRQFSNDQFSSMYDSNVFSSDNKFQQQFEWFKNALDKAGTKAGTGHKRILIPKAILDKEELEELGFVGVNIAIPEAGQTKLRSFRNLKNKYHLHEFENDWSMHKDLHESSTMNIEKERRRKGNVSIGSAIKHTFEGLPHVITEGLPGLFYFARGKVFGAEPMDVRLRKELPSQYLDYIQKKAKSLKPAFNWKNIIQAFRIPGRDDAYNTIEGLKHGGLAEGVRKDLTEFGSGYQSPHESSEGNSLAIALGGGAGITSGAAMYSAMYPWWHQQSDYSQYPRLQRLRKVGQKHGFKLFAPHLSRFFGEHSLEKPTFKDKAQNIAAKAMWGELDPETRLVKNSNFEGVLYVQSGTYKESSKPLAPLAANWGNWDIGVDKIDTWNYLKNKEKSNLHVSSLAASEFYTSDKKGLTKSGRQFVESIGGFENMVVKRTSSARGMGVWLNAAELPGDIAEEMMRNPEGFILQKKLDIAEEFRVVTVGDKPIQTTYRFGSPKVRKVASTLGWKPMKEVIDKNKLQKSPFEVIQPVFNKQIRTDLEAFATKVSKELPYEIGALDIALTKSGKFKLIEAQRQFGNISNPIVSRRIKNIITNRPAKTIIGLAAATAVVTGLTAYSLFSGRDDAYNTIEGLHPGSDSMGAQSIKDLTDFGSGWIPFGKVAEKYLQWHSKRNFSKGVMGKVFGKLKLVAEKEYLINEKKLFKSKLLTFGVLEDKGWNMNMNVERKYAANIVSKMKSTKQSQLINSKFSLKTTAGVGGKKPLLKATVKNKKPMLEATVKNKKFLSLSNTDLQSSQPIIRIPGRDDAYNTIEGLKHLGLAQTVRKDLTDFGSGWDPLRAMAKKLFKESDDSFGQLIKLPEFKEALKTATKKELLGKGMSGAVHKMEGIFRGEKFEFARKAGTIGKEELSAMRAVEGSIGPSVYSSKLGKVNMGKFAGEDLSLMHPSKIGKQGTIDMELFVGRPVSSINALHAEELKPGIEKAFSKLHEAGFEHGDPHLGNVMKVATSKGDKIGLIDFGQAKRLDEYKSAIAAKEAAAVDIRIVKKLTKAKIEGGSAIGALDPFANPAADPFAAGGHVSAGDVLGMLGAPSAPRAPSEEIAKRVRMMKFKRISEKSVGIGLRYAKNGGRGHCKFNSTEY